MVAHVSPPARMDEVIAIDLKRNLGASPAWRQKRKYTSAPVPPGQIYRVAQEIVLSPHVYRSQDHLVTEDLRLGRSAGSLRMDGLHGLGVRGARSRRDQMSGCIADSIMQRDIICNVYHWHGRHDGPLQIACIWTQGACSTDKCSNVLCMCKYESRNFVSVAVAIYVVDHRQSACSDFHAVTNVLSAICKQCKGIWR